MKRIILSAMLVSVLGIASSFAKANHPNETTAWKNFKKEFAGAELVQWSSAGDFQKASFILAGHRAEAYYNADGELAGSVRDLFYDQLPLAVMKAVDSRFENAGIIDVREISNTEGTSYKVQIEYGKKKYSLSLASSGELLEKRSLK